MKEAAIILIAFGVVVTFLAGAVWFCGGTFGLHFAESWYLSFIALVFVVPAVLNIHIFASPRSRESAPRRLLALVRAIGMLIVASACIFPMFSIVASRSFLLWGMAIGLLMHFGTLLCEDRLRRRK